MASSVNSDSMELLFFDTFHHETCDDYNLDLVQFPLPVFISELRVIPLGTKVQADFPGGVRLGATNPSQFKVDFFVNDLSKNGASTFHKLGGLDYKHNVEIQIISQSNIPTDGLVLQGLYSTITLAIYGKLAKVTKEKVQSPPPPPPPPPILAKPKTSVNDADSKDEFASDTWSRESNEKPLSVKTEVRSCTPEPSPQYPIPTVPSTHLQQDYEQWPEPDPRSHEYSVIPTVIESTHKRKDERTSGKSRESTRDERRESGISSGSSSYKDLEKSDREREKGPRERDRNAEDRSERDRNRDRDGKVSRVSRERPDGGSHSSHREHRTIRSPPGTPLRRHPSSPKERHRPRTPPTPHPETIDVSVKPSSPVRARPIRVPNIEALKDEIFEPLTPEASLADQLEMLSDGELRDVNCPDYYEEIVSDEDEMFDGEEPMEFQNEMEYELGDDAYITAFNPFTYEAAPLLYFNEPSLTAYEIEANKKTALEIDDEERFKNLFKEGQEKHLSERWVEILEMLPSYCLQLSKVGRNDYTPIIVDWVCDALDFSLALQQQQAVFKIRHIKAGIKLANAVFEFPRECYIQLLERDVQRKLLKLYSEEYMALSLKLLILKALDASVRFKEGMDTLLGTRKTNCKDVLELKTGYQMLLDILLTKQMTRLAVVITALFRKVHFYEVLEKLSTVSEGIFSKFSSVLKQNNPEESDKLNYEIESSRNVTNELKFWMDSNKIVLKTIFTCLKEIQSTYSNAQFLISQPSRSLPVKSQFCLQKNSNDPFPSIYSIFNDCKFLEMMLLLISFPPTVTQPIIVLTIKDILSEMLLTQHGLLYLLSHYETTNAIIRILLQCTDDVREDVPNDSALQELGQQMAYYLHVLQCVDILFAETPPGQRCHEIDDPDVLSSLHDLYTMTFTSQGQSTVAYIFGMNNNLEAIIPFIQFLGDEDYDMKLKKSSCMGYSIEILLMTMRICESVEHLEKFSEKLLTIAGQDLNPKVQELGLWLAPIRKMSSFSYQEIPQLCTTVKSSVENILSFPEELITSLRILRHIVAPTYVNNFKEGFQEDLKYKYAIVQLHANDGLSCFLAILEKICDAFNYPFLHSSSFVGQKGILLIAVVKPTVFLIMQLISYIIYCRKNEFNVLTPIPILMRVYSLMSSFPAISIQSNAIQSIQSDIIDTLLAYTQPDVEISDSEEALAGNLWTKMVQEVFKFISKSPSLFVSSLTVLSELLPLPLPIQSHELLSPSETNKAINYRKFWSLHLYSLAPEIQTVISTLGGSGDQNLQQIVRRVSIQLADLSSSTSLVVIRGILDAILDILETEINEKFTQYGHLTRLLNFLSFLVSQACAKIPLLYLIKGSSKIDKRYCDFLPKIVDLMSILNNSTEKSTATQQLQECIMSIFQSLCDTEMAFSGPESRILLPEQLANILPCREHMGIICSALWDHLIVNPFVPSGLLALRTLVMLAEHDYGFYHLKMSLDKNPNALHSYLVLLCQQTVRDIPDFLSSLTTFLELLQLMVNLDDDLKLRSYETSPLELALYLKWECTNTGDSSIDNVQSSKSQTEQENDDKSETLEEPASLHPILRLEKFLRDSNREEDNLEVQAIESLRNLTVLLNNSSTMPVKEKDFQEIILPNGESLVQQFNQRIPFVVGDIDEDGLNSAFWLTQLNADDIDQENDNVSCDLHALSVQVCANFEFAAELEKLFLTKDETLGVEKSRKANVEIGKRKYQPIINPGVKDPIRKKPFIAPMRGRGYARGAMHSSRANDPFRSRPPNTSRPPSMHVDDFVALEILQPTNAPTGASLKRDTSRARGRGFEESRDFISSRGRSFQTASNNYNRSDDRGGCLRGNSRGASTSWGNNLSATTSKSLQKFSSASSRSSSFVHPGTVDLRSDARFSSNARQSASSVRLLDISVNRLSRLARPDVAVPHGELWSNEGDKPRENRFPNSGRSSRNREPTRHPRSLTR